MKNKGTCIGVSPIVRAISRGASYRSLVSDDFAQITVDAILEAAYTGNVGDGKIFVSEVLEAYRIRTKESGHAGIN